MRNEISARHQRLKTTMIHVTHDQVEAMTMADKIVTLRAGRVEPGLVGQHVTLGIRPEHIQVRGAEAGELPLECLAPPPAHLPA